MFAFLFSEIVQYMMKQEQAAQNQSNLTGGTGQVPDLETQLHDLGKPVGEKMIELAFYREMRTPNATNSGKRELEIVNMLHFINTTLWKQLFGRQADGLEQSNTDDTEYWLSDRGPVTNKFTSIGKDRNFAGPNCAYFIAGIIEGFLRSANLAAKVTPVLHSPDPAAESAVDEAAGSNDNPYNGGS